MANTALISIGKINNRGSNPRVRAMNKEQKMIYLFNKRWDEKKKERNHDWICVGRDVLKHRVQYECLNCGTFHEMDVWNLTDENGHKQLLNHVILNCR